MAYTCGIIARPRLTSRSRNKCLSKWMMSPDVRERYRQLAAIVIGYFRFRCSGHLTLRSSEVHRLECSGQGEAPSYLISQTSIPFSSFSPGGETRFPRTFLNNHVNQSIVPTGISSPFSFSCITRRFRVGACWDFKGDGHLFESK